MQESVVQRHHILITQAGLCTKHNAVVRNHPNPLKKVKESTPCIAAPTHPEDLAKLL